MESVCSFECASHSVMNIWERGIALFEAIHPSDMLRLGKDPAGFCVYLQTYLLLTADVIGAGELMIQMREHLRASMKAPTAQTAMSCCLYASALLGYLTYRGEDTEAECFVAGAEELLSLAEKFEKESDRQNVVLTAHRLGARLVMQRIYAACALPFERAALGKEIGDFHRAYYRRNSRLYMVNGQPSVSLNALPPYYGFESDDGQEAVREYLVTHSFEMPRAERGFLYGALYHLEAYDSLLPIVLEAGLPEQDASPAALSGLLALLTMLCGVDVAMLGKGIHCAQPRLPEYIGYRLTLPSVGGMILFDEGELSDDFMV